jgi:multiple sugar transport system ATP-binding protein
VRIPAKIDVVEFLGNEELIHAESEGHEVVALVPSDRKVAVGQTVEFAVPVEKLHIFDPESEKSLVAEPSA